MQTGESFYEVQQFNRTMIWLAAIPVAFGMMLFLFNGYYRQAVNDIPFGDEPMSNASLLVVVMLVLSILLGLFWMLLTAKLELKVDKRGISYRYFPFITSWRYIPKDDIREWQIRKYFPTGYGMRFGWSFTTLNARGNIGLELKFHRGRNLRIGTQRPDDLRIAMENFFMNQQK